MGTLFFGFSMITHNAALIGSSLATFFLLAPILYVLFTKVTRDGVQSWTCNSFKSRSPLILSGIVMAGTSFCLANEVGFNTATSLCQLPPMATIGLYGGLAVMVIFIMMCKYKADGGAVPIGSAMSSILGLGTLGIGIPTLLTGISALGPDTMPLHPLAMPGDSGFIIAGAATAGIVLFILLV